MRQLIIGFTPKKSYFYEQNIITYQLKDSLASSVRCPKLDYKGSIFELKVVELVYTCTAHNPTKFRQGRNIIRLYRLYNRAKDEF